MLTSHFENLKPESLYFCLQESDISWNCLSLFTPVLSFSKEKCDVNKNPTHFRVKTVTSMRICLLSCFMLKRYHGRLNVGADGSLNFQGAISASDSSCHLEKNIFSPFFKCDKELDYILT